MAAVIQTGPLIGFAERRPRGMLEWESARKLAAPRSQVGISWSQVSAGSMKTSGPESQARPVDGFDIPEGLLELPDLNDILSVETWEKFLTHSERDILSMYLPEGVDPDSTAKDLLSRGNFHFGNPLQTWGESVCAGTMHPDAILYRELALEDQRKLYSKRLRSYHRNMVKNLQNMKQIWEDCKNSQDFVLQLQRLGTSGRPRDSHMKNVENAVLRKRSWNEVGEEVDQSRELPASLKAEKQKVNKLLEKGSKRPKLKPLEPEMDDRKTKPSRGLHRVEIKLRGGELQDFPIRTKGGKVGQPEEGTKTLKIKTSEGGTTRFMRKSPEEAKRLEIKRVEEGRTKGGQLKVSTEETRRPKIKFVEGGSNFLQVKHADEPSKRLEIKSLEEGVKGRKIRPSEEVSKRLKIKPFPDGRKNLDIKPSEEGLKRQQIRPLDDRKDVAIRPIAKRQNVQSSEEGAKRLESEYGGGSKKSQIKLSEAGRKTPLNKPLQERDLASSQKAKRSRVRPSKEERTLRLEFKHAQGGSKSLETSWEGPNILDIIPSEEGSKTMQIGAPSRGLGLKLMPLDDGSQRPKIPPPDKKDRPKEKRSKVKPQDQGTKKLKIKHTKEGQVEDDPSDFEGEWFKKYVQVTVGPLSGHRLSKATQSVKVTTTMLKDVKRRSEAGEDVHLDSLVSAEVPASSNKTPKKITDPSNEEQIIARFWQTVLIKDLPAVHALFMQRKEQLQKLAISLASGCKNLWEIEVSNDEGTQENASLSEHGVSPNQEYASPHVEYTSPSVEEHEASPIERMASPTGDEAAKSGEEAAKSGDEWPSGDEA